LLSQQLLVSVADSRIFLSDEILLVTFKLIPRLLSYYCRQNVTFLWRSFYALKCLNIFVVYNSQELDTRSTSVAFAVISIATVSIRHTVALEKHAFQANEEFDVDTLGASVTAFAFSEAICMDEHHALRCATIELSNCISPNATANKQDDLTKSSADARGDSETREESISRNNIISESFSCPTTTPTSASESPRFASLDLRPKYSWGASFLSNSMPMETVSEGESFSVGEAIPPPLALTHFHLAISKNPEIVLKQKKQVFEFVAFLESKGGSKEDSKEDSSSLNSY
jgi:hypothetical protein